MGLRVKVVLKWSAFLFLVGFTLQIISAIIVAMFWPIQEPIDNNRTFDLISAVSGSILTLPFAYIFSYKATLEYLKKLQGRFQKNAGLSIALSVVFLTFLAGNLIDYLFAGEINLTIGILPILLGVLAGRNAEAKFVKR